VVVVVGVIDRWSVWSLVPLRRAVGPLIALSDVSLKRVASVNSNNTAFFRV
jgi:hypothetical protein